MDIRVLPNQPESRKLRIWALKGNWEHLIHTHNFIVLYNFYFVYISCMCTCAHLCRWACRSQRLMSLQSFSTLLFEAPSLPEPGAHWVSKTSWAASPRDLAASASTALRLWVYTDYTWLFTWSLESQSGSLSDMARTFQIELSLWNLTDKEAEVEKGTVFLKTPVLEQNIKRKIDSQFQRFSCPDGRST